MGYSRPTIYEYKSALFASFQDIAACAMWSYSHRATSCRRRISKTAGASDIVIGRRYRRLVWMGLTSDGTITDVAWLAKSSMSGRLSLVKFVENTCGLLEKPLKEGNLNATSDKELSLF